MKKGLEYYSLDTDFFFDRDIIALGEELGAKATLIFIKILCDVYRDEGYFLKWDSFYASDTARMFEKQGIKEALVNEVVCFCFKRRLFNEELFKKYSILTSRSIQERYFRSKTSSLKRKVTVEEFIEPGLNLLNKGFEVCGNVSALSGISPQIPAKESKGKESKVDNNTIPPLSPQGENSEKVIPIIKPENVSLLLIKPPEKLNTPKFIEAWQKWEKYRKEIKKKLAPSTIKEQYAKLSKYDVDIAIAMINKSIEKGWIGLFEPKEDDKAVKPTKTVTLNENDVLKEFLNGK